MRITLRKDGFLFTTRDPEYVGVCCTGLFNAVDMPTDTLEFDVVFTKKPNKYSLRIGPVAHDPLFNEYNPEYVQDAVLSHEADRVLHTMRNRGYLYLHIEI